MDREEPFFFIIIDLCRAPALLAGFAVRETEERIPDIQNWSESLTMLESMAKLDFSEPMIHP